MAIRAYKVRNFLRKPQNIILLVLAIILSYLVLVPFVYILADTFSVHPSEIMRIPGSRVGEFICR